MSDIEQWRVVPITKKKDCQYPWEPRARQKIMQTRILNYLTIVVKGFSNGFLNKYENVLEEEKFFGNYGEVEQLTVHKETESKPSMLFIQYHTELEAAIAMKASYHFKLRYNSSGVTYKSELLTEKNKYLLFSSLICECENPNFEETDSDAQCTCIEEKKKKIFSARLPPAYEQKKRARNLIQKNLYQIVHNLPERDQQFLCRMMERDCDDVERIEGYDQYEIFGKDFPSITKVLVSLYKVGKLETYHYFSRKSEQILLKNAKIFKESSEQSSIRSQIITENQVIEKQQDMQEIEKKRYALFQKLLERSIRYSRSSRLSTIICFQEGVRDEEEVERKKKMIKELMGFDAE